MTENLLVNHTVGGIGADTTFDKLRNEYSEFEDETLRKLFQAYRSDMIYFGYEFDIETKQIIGFD